jgi:hypothetical protein
MHSGKALIFGMEKLPLRGPVWWGPDTPPAISTGLGYVHGHKGATLQVPNWGGQVLTEPPFPVEHVA